MTVTGLKECSFWISNPNLEKSGNISLTHDSGVGLVPDAPPPPTPPGFEILLAKIKADLVRSRVYTDHFKIQNFQALQEGMKLIYLIHLRAPDTRAIRDNGWFERCTTTRSAL